MVQAVFPEITCGEVPGHEVYEDGQRLAFLDLDRLSDGHASAIPEQAAATMDPLSDAAAAAIGRALPRRVAHATG
jgi:diadenosine tetraphosphate (Ap4A) HIT family hydrolase